MFEIFRLSIKKILLGAIIAFLFILPAKTSTPTETEPINVLKTESVTSSTTPVANTGTTTSELLSKNLVPQKTSTTTKQKLAQTNTPAGATPKTITIQLLPLEQLNEKARPAIVNILCTTQNGGDFKPLSGSGVFINNRGVILTNAHIGQYFLLRDYGVKNYITCVARQGSPASPTFLIEPLYVSKKWIEENKQTIKQEDPTGTGENDFAILRAVGKPDGQPLPQSFPYLEANINPELVLRSLPMLIIAYPAGFLGGATIQTSLSLTSSTGVIKELYNFYDKALLDVISVEGNILSQRGSSGGAVINQSTGKLEGIITTSTNNTSTGERVLFAITPGHIDREIKIETGQTLNEFISQDLDIAQKNFKEVISKPLIDLLIKEIEG